MKRRRIGSVSGVFREQQRGQCGGSEVNEMR